MKKRIMSLIIMAALLLSLAACGTDDPTTPPGGGEDSEFYAINQMLLAEYSFLTLTVKTKGSSVTLTDTYTATFVDAMANVDYTLESLVSFDFVNGSYVIPDYDTPKKQSYGAARVYKSGEVEVVFGDVKDVDLYALMYPKFAFSEEYFENWQLTDTTLIADISSFSSLGKFYTGIPEQGVELTVIFSEEGISEISFNYTTSLSNKVEITYEFGPKI